MDSVELLTEILRLFNNLNEQILAARMDREELRVVKAKQQSLEVIIMATAAQANELKLRLDTIEAALTAEVTEIRAIIEEIRVGGDIAPSLNRLAAVETTIKGISDALTGPGAPTPDSQVPTVPGTPSPLASALTSTSVTLTFAKSTDNVGVTGYEVWANGAKFADFPENTTPGPYVAVVNGLTPSTNYVFTVRAVDAKANFSLHSGEVIVDTPA
jgi:hypothetical protein